jgi:beta-glucosidase
LARDGGSALAKEARIRGFNVVLAGAMNLARDLHNGRTFEYYSEDPLVSAILAAEPFTEPLGNAYAVGVDKWGPPPAVDMAKHNEVALEAARQGIVLLKNDGVLPLSVDKPLKIAVIGGYAQLGVPMGIGSSMVNPVGGHAAVIPIGGPGTMGPGCNLYLLPSSPLAELKRLMPQAQVDFDPAQSPAEAELLAKRSDLVIAFGIRAEGEGYDLPDLSLPWGHDAVIDAVATTNPNTIVVLETGNPVAMPWRDKVKAVVQAWDPGQAGGQAIAEVLTGKMNPSGRLPITFPADLSQMPRPVLPGLGTPYNTPITIRYDEGAEVGYRWYAQKNHKPMYAFGYGLSYTSFDYKDLKVSGGEAITATFTVTNTGKVTGADVPQLYLTDAPEEKRLRLLGFERVQGDGDCRPARARAGRGRCGAMAHLAWHLPGGAREVCQRLCADRRRTLDVTAVRKVRDAGATLRGRGSHRRQTTTCACGDAPAHHARGAR